MEITAREKQKQRERRARRTRFHIHSGSQLPRLSVFRSGKHIYAQVIDDRARRTLVSAHDVAMGKAAKQKKMTPKASAAQVGSLIAERALAARIKEVVFDRGGYRYHGRVRALAEAARKAGLKF